VSRRHDDPKRTQHTEFRQLRLLWISPLAAATPHYRWLVGRGYSKMPVFMLELPV
jgi:hypothetical protein